MKIARLQTGLLGIAGTMLLMTGVYAQTKPAAKPAAAATKATPEEIAAGEAVYKRSCQTCHGATGVGDGPASKFLKGKLPNLTDKATMAKISDDDIEDAVENGKKTEVGTMPPFKAKLKPEEIKDVIAYVHSLAK